MMYGFHVADVRRVVLEISEKRHKTSQDISKLYHVISNTDDFVAALWNPKYEKAKSELMRKFLYATSRLEQMSILKMWYQEINKLVGSMYFTEEGVDKYGSYNQGYSNEDSEE